MKTQGTANNNYTSGRNAEITIWIIALLVASLLLVSSTGSGMSIAFEEEAYIDDIPFNTEQVVNEMLRVEFAFEEEVEVKDIPFNTADIAYNYNLERVFDFDEEAYADDMPFSTMDVVAAYQYKLALSEKFELTEEDYVDDIPFNTCMIAASVDHTHTDLVYACSK